MGHQRKKISIIAVSLLLHGGIFVLLFFFYSDEHEWTYFDTTQTAINTPETIFSEPMQQLSEPQQQIPPIPQQESWAELKPRASSLGAMEMSDENIGVETKESSSDDLTNNENDPSIRIADATQGERELPFMVSSLAKRDVSNQTDQSKPDENKQQSIKKRQAQQALASITKGYLEQLKHEGENLIKTIGGDPNKMPSAEQLKYERYLAKIQWCLQNAHNINRDKCQMHGPVEATMRVYFTLDRNGKMADLKIVQSSGDPFVDRYIRSLFEQASSSFPPVPAYIKEDPYKLLYTVMVCWNIASPTCMGFMRE